MERVWYIVAMAAVTHHPHHLHRMTIARRLAVAQNAMTLPDNT